MLSSITPDFSPSGHATSFYVVAGDSVTCAHTSQLLTHFLLAVSNMRTSCGWARQFQRRLLVSLVIFSFTLWCLLPSRKEHVRSVDLEQQYPLLWRHVHIFNGTGGGTSTCILLDNPQFRHAYILACSEYRHITDFHQPGISHQHGYLLPIFSRKR